MQRDDVVPGLGIKPPASGSSASGVPFNPFQKTLATMEPGSSPASVHRRNDTRVPGDAAGKSAMDVHSFTRMLLTGKKDATGAEANPPSNSTTVDSNSTDTSSSFDSAQPAQVESPGTSYEMSVSDDEDGVNVVSTRPQPDREKKKPPPPKSRHGKGIVQRAPQTVSFSDFSTSIASPDPPSPSLQRTPTDPAKPLPSLPESSADDGIEAMPQVARTPSNRPVPQMQPAPVPPQRKSPPAVPLARRHSQLKTATQSRQRSNSALTTDSTEEPSSNAPSTAESTSSTAQKMAPPPPPSRRRGHAASNSVSLSSPPVFQGESGGSLAQALANSSQNASQNSLTSPPPPPPRRRGGSSGRTSSEMQRPNMGELTRGSFDGGGRRGSAASSLTSPRKDSSSALASPMEEKDEVAGVGSSILADMDAFQREIDALRRANG